MVVETRYIVSLPYFGDTSCLYRISGMHRVSTVFWGCIVSLPYFGDASCLYRILGMHRVSTVFRGCIVPLSAMYRII